MHYVQFFFVFIVGTDVLLEYLCQVWPILLPCGYLPEFSSNTPGSGGINWGYNQTLQDNDPPWANWRPVVFCFYTIMLF